MPLSLNIAMPSLWATADGNPACVADEIIRVVNPLEIADWDDQVQRLSGNTFFHGSAWLRVLHETYGFIPCCIAEYQGRQLTALLPLVEVRSRLTGNRGVALPFADFCTPLAADPATEQSLIQRAIELGNARRWKTIEWRGARDQRTEIRDQKSEISNLTSDLCPPSTDLCPPSTDLCPPSTDLCPPTSDLRPLTSDLCPLTSSLVPPSDLRPLTSVLCPPTSVLFLTHTLDLISPSLAPTGGLELIGKQQKEFANGKGPHRAEQAGASESLGRGEGAMQSTSAENFMASGLGTRTSPPSPPLGERAGVRGPGSSLPKGQELNSEDYPIFNCFESSVRRAIRKAENLGVKATVTTTEGAMDVFHQLYCITRQRHGLPPQPRKFFRNIHQQIIAQSKGFIVEATHNGIPIASSIFFTCGKQALYKYGASDHSAQELRANNLLMWTAIKTLISRGFDSLHFGRTSLENEGLRRFKNSWATVEDQIHYHCYDVRRGQYITQTDNAHGWHTRLFQKVPISLARIIGSLLYQHTA